jgi:hypothetical protein
MAFSLKRTIVGVSACLVACGIIGIALVAVHDLLLRRSVRLAVRLHPGTNEIVMQVPAGRYLFAIEATPNVGLVTIVRPSDSRNDVRSTVVQGSQVLLSDSAEHIRSFIVKEAGGPPICVTVELALTSTNAIFLNFKETH